MSDRTELLEAVEIVTEASEIMKAAAAIGEHRIIDEAGQPYAVVPDGWRLTDLENTLPRPTRLRRKHALHTPDALISYATQFATILQGTTLFLTARADDLTTARLQIVFDHGSAASPEWADHRATVDLRPTAEWKVWTMANKAKFAQFDFAAFLEDNLPDIETPDGATMLEICRTIEATSKGHFRATRRETDGSTTISYSDDVDIQAASTLTVPQTFTIAVAPWQGSDRYNIECRLRVRVDKGAMAMWYDMVRPEKVLEHAFAEIVDKVATATTLTPIAGATL